MGIDRQQLGLEHLMGIDRMGMRQGQLGIDQTVSMGIVQLHQEHLLGIDRTKMESRIEELGFRMVLGYQMMGSFRRGSVQLGLGLLRE